MKFLKREGTALAYEDSGVGSPPLVLIHGCGFDHSSLAPLAQLFFSRHRVISVDLRGHGESDAPRQDYSMSLFADDIAWLCKELACERPVVIGHSMGGNIALELASRYPEILTAIVLLDSFVFLSQDFLDTLPPLIEALKGPNFLEAWKQALLPMCLPTDRFSLSAIAQLQVAGHVLASAFPNHTVGFDSAAVAAGCGIPVAYVNSWASRVDLSRFGELVPQLVTARTLGSGHLSPLEVPDQLHAMIAQFLRLSGKRSTAS